MSKKNWNWYQPRSSLPAKTDTWKKSPAKKDTNRWCKGHVGREHEWVIRWRGYGMDPHVVVDDARPDQGYCHWSRWTLRLDNRPVWVCWHERVCANCGRVASWTANRLTSGECPDYDPVVPPRDDTYTVR